MFVWSYWKTIFTKPANPSKEVQWAHSVCAAIKSIWWIYFSFYKKNLFTPVLPAQGWEGTLWEGREARVPARDPVESCHQSASVHTHRSRRYVQLWMYVKLCLFCCLFAPLCWNRLTNFNELLCQHDTAIRYCDRCQVIKPDRCHHCSACDM